MKKITRQTYNPTFPSVSTTLLHQKAEFFNFFLFGEGETAYKRISLYEGRSQDFRHFNQHIRSICIRCGITENTLYDLHDRNKIHDVDKICTQLGIKILN